MLVIEGKSNKSKALENWIRKEYMGDRLVIIDNQGIKALEPINGVEHYIVNMTAHEIIRDAKRSVDIFSKYDWIAFYVNIPTDELSLFQELDRQITQNIAVTVQRNDRGLTSKYFL